jgi:uncharacterized repeat protein (TIGR01451 family)/fimbrial isopeptide formation D2 family protein
MKTKSLYTSSAFGLAVFIALMGWVLLNLSTSARAETDVINAAPDLSVVKVGNPITFSVGGSPQPVVFRIDVRNTGNANASGVVVTEVIPAGMTFDASRSTSGWNCVGSNCTFAISSTIVADPGGNNSPLSIFFAVSPSSISAQQDLIQNVVRVGDNGANGADADPSNNVYTATAPLGARTSITASKRATLVVDANGDGQYSLGDEISYLVTITNTGSRNAGLLRLQDDIDAANLLGLEVVPNSASASQGTVEAFVKAVTVNFGTVAPGATVTAAFRIRGFFSPELVASKIDNIGLIYDAYGFYLETNPASISIQRNGYNISTTKRNNKQPNALVGIGETLTYTIDVTNTGSKTFGVLKLIDEIDSVNSDSKCVDVVTGSITSSKAGSTTSYTKTGTEQKIEVGFGSFAPGEKATVTFRATTRATGDCGSAINIAGVYSGTVLFAQTNSVINVITADPYPFKVFMPVIQR